MTLVVPGFNQFFQFIKIQRVKIFGKFRMNDIFVKRLAIHGNHRTNMVEFQVGFKLGSS